MLHAGSVGIVQPNMYEHIMVPSQLLFTLAHWVTQTLSILNDKIDVVGGYASFVCELIHSLYLQGKEFGDNQVYLENAEILAKSK